MSNAISSVYFHIENGGVQIGFYDDQNGGPTIEIISTHLGNNAMVHRIHTDRESIEVLASAAAMAAEHEYEHPPSTCAAIVPRRREEGGTVYGVAPITTA